MIATKRDKNFTNGKGRKQREMTIQRQIAFATGLFEGDVTMRTLLESLAEGVVIVDEHGTILLVNTRAQQMFQYPNAGDILGKHHDILLPGRLHRIHKGHMSDYNEEPRTRPMGIGLDLVGRRSDGSEFPVEISLSFVETTNGRFVLAFISDITLRKDAEEALKHRAGELEFANKELETFSYSVTHDLRNPLQAIVGLGDILKEDYADQLSDKAKELVHRIVDNGNKMNAVIDAILNLSKVARKEMTFQEIDLTGIAESAIADLRKTQPDRRITSPSVLPVIIISWTPTMSCIGIFTGPAILRHPKLYGMKSCYTVPERTGIWFGAPLAN